MTIIVIDGYKIAFQAHFYINNLKSWPQLSSNSLIFAFWTVRQCRANELPEVKSVQMED